MEDSGWEDVKDYGNGVYYFNTSPGGFGKALSKFLDEHKELEVAATAPSSTAYYGTTTGYFVVFKEK